MPLIWQGDTVNISPNYSQRAAFYGVGGIPHVQFNGYVADVGGGTNTYNRYLNVYNNLINLQSPLELELHFSIGDNNSVILHTKATVTGEITTTNNKIVFLITRNLSDSYFSSVATYEYFDFNLTQTGQEQTFDYTLPINPNWTYDELSIAVLIQTYDNDPAPNKHKIVQSAFHTFTELMNPITQQSIDFGEVEVNETATQILSLTNYFSTPMNCMAFPVYGFSSELAFSIEPFSVYNLEIIFSPTQATDYYAEMIITTDNPSYSGLFVTLTGSGMNENESEESIIPVQFADLQQNFPNPFNPNTRIDFSLPETEKLNAVIVIYNTIGQKVKQFDVSQNTNGYVLWDGKDFQTIEVPSGIYLYQLQTKQSKITKKMILLK